MTRPSSGQNAALRSCTNSAADCTVSPIYWTENPVLPETQERKKTLPKLPWVVYSRGSKTKTETYIARYFSSAHTSML